MTEPKFQPGDIIRRVIGDSPSYMNGSLRQLTKYDLGVGRGRDFYEKYYELVHRPAQWHVFDREDESTWPTEDGKYWVALSHGRHLVTTSLWIEDVPWDPRVTHWMPYAVPQPPKEES